MRAKNIRIGGQIFRSLEELGLFLVVQGGERVGFGEGFKES
jgi:hypothetical protein